MVVTTTLRVKFTDAIRCFEAAGDTYRQLGKWRNAGAAYAQCAMCEQKMKEPLCAASYFVDAAEALVKVDPLEGIGQYGKAIAEYAVLGRFHVAAAIQRTVADVYEEDEAMYDAAVSLGYAADYYLGEAMGGQAMACLLKAGRFLVLEERYELASKSFQRAIDICLDDNLLKFNSSGIALDILLCFLCLRDDERALDFIEAHTDLDFGFAVSRERRFALDIILNCQERNKHSLVDHAWNFDYVHEFRPYQLHMLHELFEAVQEPVIDSGSELEESEDSWQEKDEAGDAGAADDARSAGRSSGRSSGGRSSGRSSRRSSRRSRRSRSLRSVNSRRTST